MINLSKAPISNEGQNKLILCGLFMTAIDGQVDESELDVVFKNPYWSNLVYDGCSDEFFAKLKEGNMLEFCKSEVKANLTEDADKQAFINGMIHVILADGVVDEHEVALLAVLANECGIGSEELNERIAAFSSSGGETKLILCALLMTAIDGNIDDSELQVVFQDAYWSNFVYEGCSQEFSTLLEGDGLLEICRKECAENVKTEAQKLSFVHGLLKIILADGVVDDNETALLVDLTSSIGISSDELSAIIKSYGFVADAGGVPSEAPQIEQSESAKSPEPNKLILAALLMTAIDGDIDESEINVVINDPYWSKLVYKDCVEEFKQRLDDDSLLDVCRAEAVAHVKTEDEKKAFVEGLIKIVLADGVVDNNEVGLLMDLTSGIGITNDELNAMIDSRNSSNTQSAASHAVVEEDKKWFDSNLLLILLVLFFWPGALVVLFLRWKNK